MTNEERLAMIEECARELEATAILMRQVTKDLDNSTRQMSIDLALAYEMAADTIRKMNPAYVAAEKRNANKYYKYLQQQAAGNHGVQMPDLEPVKPTDH